MAVDLLETVDRRDVRVAQLRKELRLALETLQPFPVLCELRRQHLDGDVAAERRVAGPVDFALYACESVKGETNADV